MFSLQPNGSKIAMWGLCRLMLVWKYELLDCQIMSPHLASLGAVDMPREWFLRFVAKNQNVSINLHEQPHWNVREFRALPRAIRS